MTTTVKQIKNSNGTFQYLVNDKIFHKISKKDYSYFLTEVSCFSTSLKNIQNQEKYWFKYGNPKSIDFNKMQIIEIEK
jgi:hypothetical protein